MTLQGNTIEVVEMGTKNHLILSLLQIMIRLRIVQLLGSPMVCRSPMPRRTPYKIENSLY